MPHFDLVPDPSATPIGTNNWSCSTGSDFVTLVDEDDDSTYIWETLQNGEINYAFLDPTVLEASIDFTEDVTVSAFVHAHYTESGADVAMSITTNGTGISIPVTNITIDDSAYPAYSGPSSTVKSFGNLWDYTGLKYIQMKLICTGRPARFNFLRVSYIFYRVSYTEIPLTDSATFFGANF